MNSLIFAQRENTSLLTEKVGDFFLTPARTLFGGRNVIDSKKKLFSQSTPQATTVEKVIAASLLPFSLLGIVLKISCLYDRDFRSFHNLDPLNNTQSDPKLYEMAQHVHFTAKFTDDLFTHLHFKPLGLMECACMHTRAFHRFHSPRREKLEQSIVSAIDRLHADKNEPVRLLSMGSGKMMSDFLVIEKLILNGHTTIVLDAIDPEIDHKNVCSIQDYFANYSNVSVTVKGYKSIDELPEDAKDYSAILAIDYDCLASFIHTQSIISLKDLMLANALLQDKGSMALGFSRDDTIISKDAKLQVCTKTSSIEKLSEAIESFLQTTKSNALEIALPAINFAAFAHILMFCIYLAQKRSNKKLDSISISLLQKNRDSDNQKEFQKLMQVLFPNTSITLSDHTESSQYDFLFTGVLEAEYKENKLQTLLKNSEQVSGQALVLQKDGSFFTVNSFN